MRVALFFALFLMAADVPAKAGPSAAPQSILVLDASGSMWGQINGTPKITMARDAVGAMLDGWSGGDLGLIVYGHRSKGDCADIELLIEPVGLDAAAIRRQVDALNPKGMTPISAAVRQAAERLRYTEQKATVILISDGEETCSADPCALGAELERLGVDFTAHVVGFDVQAGSSAETQLRCLAQTTGGRYLNARDAGELNHALGQIAEAAPSVPGIRAKEGQSWMPGYALHVENAITLDASAHAALESRDFTTDQTAEDCQALCDANDQCAGWHYEPTGSYFIDHPRCHVKSGAFAIRLREEGDGWVAGIKSGVKLVLDEQFEE